MSSPMTLYDTIRRIVQEEVARIRTAELAVVQEIHPHADDGDNDNYDCTVALRDSGIVLKHVPLATQRIGVAAIPEVSELVLVQFIGGDINAPVITGRLYNDEDRPPANDAGHAITHLPLGAEEGDAVHLELNSGETRELIIKLGSGLALTLRDDDPAVELEVDGGAAIISIARDGAINLESNADINIKSAANVTVEASGDLTLKGATVNIN